MKTKLLFYALFPVALLNAQLPTFSVNILASGLTNPVSGAFDSNGNLYVAEYNGHRVKKITPSGSVTTVAGTGTAGYSGDGGPATSAQLSTPTGVALDAADNIYIADRNNNRIRKITASTGVITTIGGTGSGSTSGDGGLATSAAILSPLGISVDANNNIYIPTAYRIRKISASTGSITTIAGTGVPGYSGNGGAATSAQINLAVSVQGAVYVNSAGEIFIPDYSNYAVRKVDMSGIISTFAGTGTFGFSGDGGLATSAQIGNPSNITGDVYGNIFINDKGNRRLRVVSPTGSITTIAGNGSSTVGVNGTAALSSGFNFPFGLSMDASDFIYITDYSSGNIIKHYYCIRASASSTNVLCNGASNGSIFVTATGIPTSFSYTWTSGLGNSPTANNLAPGTYTCNVSNTCGTASAAITITEPSALTLTTSTNTSVVCSGDAATLTAIGAGGTGTKTYSWTTGASGSVSVINPTASTVYTVTMQDANNCAKSETVSIQVNALPVVSVNSGSICSGQSFTMVPAGANTYTVQGGSTVVSPAANSSYTVTGTSTAGCVSSTFATANVTVNANPTISVNSGTTCSGNAFAVIPSGANTYSIQGGSFTVSPVANSSYTVAGTSAEGCVSQTVAVSNVTVIANPTITVNSGSICSGSTFTINPAGASTYTIQGGSNTVSPGLSSSYTVSGTSSAGCVSQIFAISNITVNSNPTITVNSGSICPGAAFTIAPSGANTYTIQGGSATVSPSTTSSYTVSGMSSAGCMSQSFATSYVTVHASPIITVNSGSICNGQSFTMSPTGANTYTFSSGSSVVMPISNTNYSVTGTSSAGCASSVAAVSNITVHALPVISVNSGSICNGQSFTISPAGASTYTFSNGSPVVTPTSNASYSITGTSTAGCMSSAVAVSNVTVYALPVISVNSGTVCAGQSFTMVPSGASTYTYSNGNAVVTPTITSSYSVTGTSANGCVSASAAVSNVTVNALPVITVNSGVICNGQSFTIAPSGATTYTISGGSAIVSPSVSSSYSVTGTDAVGCVSALAAVSNVTVHALPVVTATISNPVICDGASITLNGGGADTYTWTGGVTDGVAFTPTVSGSYTVTGTNTLTGCTSTNNAVQSVTVNPNPVISAAGGIICGGSNYTITPAGGSTYTISGGSFVVSPPSTTSYSITGTSPEGCTGNIAVVTVSVQTSLTLSIAGPTSVCEGQPVNLTANGATTYSWNTGATGNAVSLTPSVSTTYSVLGSSGTCSYSTMVSITVNPNPTITAVSGSSVICTGETVSITASGAMSYTWNTSATGTIIVESPLLATTYTVTGEDANGCINTASITQSVSECTGFSNTLPETAIAKVYPNPGNGRFTVELTEDATLSIYNTLGEIVYGQKHQDVTTIDISHLNNGVYFLRFVQHGKQITYKIIKE